MAMNRFEGMSGVNEWGQTLIIDYICLLLFDLRNYDWREKELSSEGGSAANIINNQGLTPYSVAVDR